MRHLLACLVYSISDLMTFCNDFSARRYRKLEIVREKGVDLGQRFKNGKAETGRRHKVRRGLEQHGLWRLHLTVPSEC